MRDLDPAVEGLAIDLSARVTRPASSRAASRSPSYRRRGGALIVHEAGGVVTRPDGGSIAGHPAVGSGDGFGIAVVASASAALHDGLVEAIARGMQRLRAQVGD